MVHINPPQIIADLDRQLQKAISKATAKLDKLKAKTKDMKVFNKLEIPPMGG